MGDSTPWPALPVFPAPPPESPKAFQGVSGAPCVFGRASSLGFTLCCCILKFFITLEQGTLHFPFARGPTNYAAATGGPISIKQENSQLELSPTHKQTKMSHYCRQQLSPGPACVVKRGPLPSFMPSGGHRKLSRSFKELLFCISG